jgi:hypothetical protein
MNEFLLQRPPWKNGAGHELEDPDTLRLGHAGSTIMTGAAKPAQHQINLATCQTA